VNDTSLFDLNGTHNSGVLLVCRSANTLGALASILNKAGSIVLTAQTPTDAWDIVRRGTVGCVVLDVTHLTHDSMGLFRACRSSRNTFSIPFLFLTTDNCIPPKFDGVWPETARDAWLALPCPAPQFLSAVRNLLAANVPQNPAPIQMDDNEPDVDASKVSTPTRRAVPVQSKRRAATGVFNPAQTQSGMLAVNADGLANALFSGKLGTLQFAQILNLIEPLRLTGALKIFDGVRTGDVHFVDGKVHHAELNEIVGSEALFLLFHLSKGSFQFEPGPATQFRTVEGNTMHLLLEGMRKMDEAKASISAMKERHNTGAYASVMVVK
jgi:DNA-binding response OmpR family regulator